MILTLKPLNFADINHFTYSDRLYLQQGNGETFYAQLFRAESAVIVPNGVSPMFAQTFVVDAPVRYLPLAGSTVQIVFPRSPSIQATPANQDVSVTGVMVDTRDASIYKFVLTASQVSILTSEGVRLSITESGVTSVFLVNSFVTKRLNIPGA